MAHHQQYNHQVIKELDFKIIVARHQEDTNWLEEFAPKIAIQNKGPLTSIPFDLWQYTKKLPNIGLDQHSHLDFIISNYEKLPNICVFIQANIEEHIDTFSPYLTTNKSKEVDEILPYSKTLTQQDIIYNYIKQVHLYGYTLNAKTYTRRGDFCAFSELHIDSPEERSTDLMFGGWFEKTIGQPCPSAEHILWFKNAIFGVAKSFILTRPKSYYQTIKDQITKPRQDILHYIERSWVYMLNIVSVPLPHSYQTALIIYRHIFEVLNNLIIASGQQLVEGSLFFYGAHDISFNEEFIHKQVNLFNLAKDADYILEIGFNAGHSTALMLLANPHSKILHFDLAEHAYGKRCYEYLKSVFGPHRFIDFVAGDSTQTVPAYINTPNTPLEIYTRKYINKTEFKGFDLLHIDGGHSDNVARSDIIHTAQYAYPKHNTMVFDDTNYDNLQRIVDEAIASNLVSPRTDFITEDYCGQCHHFIGHYNITV